MFNTSVIIVLNFIDQSFLLRVPPSREVAKRPPSAAVRRASIRPLPPSGHEVLVSFGRRETPDVVCVATKVSRQACARAIAKGEKWPILESGWPCSRHNLCRLNIRNPCRQSPQSHAE